MQYLVMDEEGRITVPPSERARLGLHPGDALLVEPTDDGVRLVVVAESLGDASLALLERADREGTLSVRELIEREGVDVTAALRDVTFEYRRRNATTSGQRA